MLYTELHVLLLRIAFAVLLMMFSLAYFCVACHVGLIMILLAVH